MDAGRDLQNKILSWFQPRQNSFSSSERLTSPKSIPEQDDRKSEIWVQSNGLYTQVMDINLQGFFVYCRNVIERSIGAAGFTLIVEESVPEQFNLIALACPIERFIEPP